ncbi:MAG TPA: AAA family ATPase [Candidatus Bathyarchaeota archaeon]|nr:AAA family ATPase [Candidatus Bathyarchaeota archaeon]
MSSPGGNTPPEQNVLKHIRRAYHVIPPLRIIIDELRKRGSLKIELKRIEDPEEHELWQSKIGTDVAYIVNNYDTDPEAGELFYLGLIGKLRKERYSNTVSYLVQAKREGIRPFITMLQYLLRTEVIRAETKLESFGNGDQGPWCLSLEIERGANWGQIFPNTPPREAGSPQVPEGAPLPRLEAEPGGGFPKLRELCREICRVPYRAIECVENIFRILESYGFVERLKIKDVKEELRKSVFASLYGYEYQFDLLLRAAYLAFSTKIRVDPEDVRPILVLVFGYPGTGKTPLYKLLLSEIIRKLKGEVDIIESIRINCQRLTSLLDPEEVKEVLRVIEHWIDTRGDYTILFLDEAEGIAFERGTERASTRRELTFWVMSLWDKRKRMLVILVTNYPDLVDEAIRNRADLVVYFTPITGRYATRKNLRYFIVFFWVKKLLTWIGWSLKEDEIELEDRLREKLTSWIKEVLKDEEIVNEIRKLTIDLSMDAECACNPRNLYEGIRNAVKFFFSLKASEIPIAYVEEFKKIAENPRQEESGLKDWVKGLVKEFISKLKKYIRAFGGIFPLYSDIARYEDRYCDLIKAARRSMRSAVYLFDEIDELMFPECMRRRDEDDPD